MSPVAFDEDEGVVEALRRDAELDTERRNEASYPALVLQGDSLASSLAPVSGKPCTFSGLPTALRLTDSDAGGATLEPIHTGYGNILEYLYA